jgi:hypothetical protein
MVLFIDNSLLFFIMRKITVEYTLGMNFNIGMNI